MRLADDKKITPIMRPFHPAYILEVLPQLIELWGLNVETQAESKKNIAKLTAR